MLEDTSIIAIEFSSENFRIQDIVTHSIEAIETASNTQGLRV